MPFREIPLPGAPEAGAAQKHVGHFCFPPPSVGSFGNIRPSATESSIGAHNEIGPRHGRISLCAMSWGTAYARVMPADLAALVAQSAMSRC